MQQCSNCGNSELLKQSEIYQDCVAFPEGERCIALIVPVFECTHCGERWLTHTAQDMIEREYFGSL